VLEWRRWRRCWPGRITLRLLPAPRVVVQALQPKPSRLARAWAAAIPASEFPAWSLLACSGPVGDHASPTAQWALPCARRRAAAVFPNLPASPPLALAAYGLACASTVCAGVAMITGRFCGRAVSRVGLFVQPRIESELPMLLLSLDPW